MTGCHQDTSGSAAVILGRGHAIPHKAGYITSGSLTVVPDNHRDPVHPHGTAVSVWLCTCTVALLVPLQLTTEKFKGIEPGTTDLSIPN